MQTLRAIEARETVRDVGSKRMSNLERGSREVDEGVVDKAKNWSVCPASRSGAVLGGWWWWLFTGMSEKKKKKKGFLFLGSRHARRPINLTIFHSLCSGYPPGHWEWISAVVDVAVNGRLTSRPLQKAAHPFPIPQGTVWGAMAVTRF